MDTTFYQQLHTRDNLFNAWKSVLSKGSAGGIDGVSVDLFAADLEANLQKLQDELAAGEFIPQPYQEIKIPKDDHEFRALSLMCIRDKVVQQAARTLLEPLLERMFLDVSYGYRVGKGTLKAIGRVNHLLVNEKREWLTSCDIDSYFDNINHDRLMTMLASRISDKPFLNLIRIWLRMGRIDQNLKWRDSTLGIPQGGIISPLLSNFYLNPLDHFCVDRKLGYVRYADDFIILSRTEEEATQALCDVRSFLLKKLDLRLNEGSCALNLSQGFIFLGITFKGSERLISDEKLADIIAKIRRAVNIDRMQSAVAVKECLQGISAYYGTILPQRFLEPMDQALWEALKEEARTRYANGEIDAKQHILDIVNQITLLSATWQINRNKETRELLAYCRKRPKKELKADASGSSIDPVLKRKREYRKLEAAGFELIVSRPGAFIGRTQKGIVVKVKGIVVHQAPLLNLKHILITSSSVTLSTNVITHAARNHIPIDFFDSGGFPYARLASFNSADYSLQRAQLAAEGTGMASELAKAFVQGKIRNQMNLAKYYHKYRKSFDEGFVIEFTANLARMEAIVAEIKALPDSDHATVRGKLFSIEGRAAAAYWDIIKALLDDMIVFEGRVGQGAKDLVNSLLNYGYAILYSKIWNAVNQAGLTPFISFLHVPQAGKPTLIFDLIEEFRPQAVDRVVFSLINKRVELKMDGQLLSEETRNRLAAEVLERVDTVEPFRGRELRLYEIMREQSRNVASFLKGELDKYSPYIAKW